MNKGFFACFFLTILPILPIVVVLPPPCKPTTITIVGFLFNSRGAASPPNKSTSSSLSILTNISPGLILFLTSSPSAFSLTLSINSLTIFTLTSASSKHSLISLTISLIFSSLITPLDLMLLTTF